MTAIAEDYRKQRRESFDRDMQAWIEQKKTNPETVPAISPLGVLQAEVAATVCIMAANLEILMKGAAAAGDVSTVAAFTGDYLAVRAVMKALQRLQLV